MKWPFGHHGACCCIRAIFSFRTARGPKGAVLLLLSCDPICVTMKAGEGFSNTCVRRWTHCCCTRLSASAGQPCRNPTFAQQCQKIQEVLLWWRGCWNWCWKNAAHSAGLTHYHMGYWDHQGNDHCLAEVCANPRQKIRCLWLGETKIKLTAQCPFRMPHHGSATVRVSASWQPILREAIRMLQKGACFYW